MPGIGEPRPSNHLRLAGLRNGRIEGFEKHLIFYKPEGDGIAIVRVLHGAPRHRPHPRGRIRRRGRRRLTSGQRSTGQKRGLFSDHKISILSMTLRISRNDRAAGAINNACQFHVRVKPRIARRGIRVLLTYAMHCMRICDAFSPALSASTVAMTWSSSRSRGTRAVRPAEEGTLEGDQRGRSERHRAVAPRISSSISSMSGLRTDPSATANPCTRLDKDRLVSGWVRAAKNHDAKIVKTLSINKCMEFISQA